MSSSFCILIISKRSILLHMPDHGILIYYMDTIEPYTKVSNAAASVRNPQLISY